MRSNEHISPLDHNYKYHSLAEATRAPWRHGRDISCQKIRKHSKMNDIMSHRRNLGQFDNQKIITMMDCNSLNKMCHAFVMMGLWSGEEGKGRES